MSSRFSRIATALALTICLWTSAIAGSAAKLPQQTQDQTTSQTQGTGDNKAPASAAPKSTGRPLSTNEDPSMIGKRNIGKGVWSKIPLLSTGTQKEVAIGRELAAEVEKQAKMVDDPVVTEYVNRVGQNVVLHSDAKVPFTIKVIDSDEVNAFALPGGFFFVNKGLILAADNEAELAGVMAHEIAHVAARHAMENQAKMNAMQIGAIAGTILTGGILGEVIYDTAGLWLPLSFLKFSRNAEAEADRLGVQYLYASGYDPNAMATMFEKLSAQNKKKPGLISKAFASHPAPPDRRAASIALVARFPEREEYVVNTSEFQKVKARLLRLSNARATTAGNIASGDAGAPGRPTLKRRQPTPDESTTSSDSNGSTTTSASNGGQNPSDSKAPEPPKLRRRDVPNPPASSQPNDQP